MTIKFPPFLEISYNPSIKKANPIHHKYQHVKGFQKIAQNYFNVVQSSRIKHLRFERSREPTVKCSQIFNTNICCKNSPFGNSSKFKNTLGRKIKSSDFIKLGVISSKFSIRSVYSIELIMLDPRITCKELVARLKCLIGR